jgi:antitoxin component YwqK of YwqJK toxin-antitoxin module
MLSIPHSLCKANNFLVQTFLLRFKRIILKMMIQKNLLVTAAFVMVCLFTSAQEGVLNQLDSKGLKQGAWEKKFDNEDKTIRYRGQFENDKPVGTFFYYYETGEKSSEVTYIGKDGVQSDAKFFHLNGAVLGEGKYVNQKKVGQWKYYDDQTVLSSLENYIEGKLTDISKIYFLNGTLAAEIPYENGLKSGSFVEYFSDGNVRMKGTYQDNTYTGEYIQYFADGKVMIKGQYRAAVKDGLWVYYAEDGRIKAQQVFQKGRLLEEKIEEGFEPATVPIEIEEKDKIDENELLEEYYKKNEPGK